MYDSIDLQGIFVLYFFFNCNLPCIGYFISLRVSFYIYIFIPSTLGISRRVFGQTLKLLILIELHVYQLLGISVFGQIRSFPVLFCCVTLVVSRQCSVVVLCIQSHAQFQ